MVAQGDAGSGAGAVSLLWDGEQGVEGDAIACCGNKDKKTQGILTL